MEYLTLKDIAIINMGQSPNSKTYNGEKKGIPFYQGKSDFGKINPIPRVWCSNPIKIAEKDDILISVRAPIGDTNIAIERCCIGRGLASIRPLNKNINQKYLYYLLNSKYNELNKFGTGSTFKAITKDNLCDLKCNKIPNIREQIEVVKKLDNVNQIIEIKKKQVRDLNTIVKSQFVEMFLKNEFPKEKLENNVEEMFIGPFGSALKNECFIEENNGYCVVYEQKHAIYKNIEDFRWVDKDKYESLKRFNVQPKDIIVSCRGTIGKTFVIPENAPLGIMHPSIMKIRLKKEKYIPEFFEMVLQHYFLEKENQTNGATIKMGIKASTLEKEDFIIPDMELQIKYLTFVKQIDKQKFEIENSLKEMQELYESLMEKYFG